jgi:hypothetical protein
MAYTPATFGLKDDMFEGTFKEWVYVTTDSEATVKGAGYFSDAGKKGVFVGDLVMVVNQTAPAVYLLQFSTVATTGNQAGTVAATVVTT